MLATCVVGGAGLALAFVTLGSESPDLACACLLALGTVVILYSRRRSAVSRSDAARMRCELGLRNNVQIEVGLASLTWGLLEVLAPVLDRGSVVRPRPGVRSPTDSN